MSDPYLPASRRRAEGRLPHAKDTLRDVGEGIVGALGMLVGLLTPFLRSRRSRWGLDGQTAARPYPGDFLVPDPSWSWTHGVEIDAPAEAVWPWVAQIGQDKAGFYSYQFLENLAGCDVQNAERVHSEWQDLKTGDPLRLHASGPPLHVAAMERGRWFVAGAGEKGGPVQVSWLFVVEPLGEQRCRFISRYRVATGPALSTRLLYGPVLIEPIGFVMDRMMLLGVKERAERPLREPGRERQRR